MLEGINVVTLDKGDEKERYVDCLSSFRMKILNFFGKKFAKNTEYLQQMKVDRFN